MVRWGKITMLSDEEKKAIEIIKCIQENGTGMMPIYRIDDLANAIKTILNLIEKQSKEIEELNKSDESKEQSSMKYYNLYRELEDKIKAKIEEVDKDENASIPDFIEYAKEYATQKLQSLLEKE